MRTRTLVLLALLAALVGLITASPTLAAVTTLTATLEGGDAEDPPGDPDGSGTATITIDPATDEVCWDLASTNIADAVVSHIHVGAAGVNGGVVVPLDVDGFSGTSEGCVTDAAADLEGILANPAGFYVNIHTADYAAGAIRGQLATQSGPPNTAVSQPVSSPLVPLGTLVLLIGLAATLQAVRTRS